MKPQLLCATLSIAAALVLSGCTSAQPKPAATDEPTGPTAGVDTGAIMGLVTSSELSPIRNAQAALQSGGADPVLSDGDGRFHFNELAPGRHVVFVTAIGYASQARAVDVVAAEISQVSFQMEPLATSDPYSSLELKEGFISCGTGSGIDGVVGFTQVECGSNDPNQKFLFNYTFGSDLKGILFEMVWTPNQVLSKDLVLNVEKDGCGFTCGVDDTFAQQQGCCMIRVALTIDDMKKPAGELPATDFEEDGGTIQTRTFPAFGESGSPTTVFTSQDFDIYVEYFYNELPADWDSRTNVPD